MLVNINSTYLLILGGILIVSFAVNYIFINFYLTIKKQAPSVIPIRTAYKKHKDVVEVIDGSGTITHFVGDKDKRYDVEYKNKDYGIKIDSNYSTVTPSERYKNGVRVLRYGISLHFPTDSRGPHALLQLIDYIRTNYKDFDVFSDDMLLIEFVDMDSEDLKEYVTSKLKDFDPNFDIYDEDRVDSLIGQIEDIKRYLPELKIRSRPMSIAKGLRLVPTAYTAQDCSRVVQLTQFKTKLEGQLEVKIWTYATVIIGFICALGAVVYITTM